MDLKDFVSTTIADVLNGVKESKELSGKTVQLIPGVNNGIQFDVAVTVSEEKTSGGKAGVKVVGIGGEGAHERTVSKETVSRIKFTVSR